MLNTSKIRCLLRAMILRILQRPKVLMFLSAITVCFFLNRSNSPAMLEAHVEFKGIKRTVSFDKGDDVLKLRYFIMIAFADVGLDKLPPARIELLKYDESVQDYVPLNLSAILRENVQIKVEVTGDEGPAHPVISNTPYRLWNPATTSLLQRDSNNIISCNGSFKDMDYATVAKTGPNDATKTGFAFFFKNTSSSKTYVMNATNGGKFMVAAGPAHPVISNTPYRLWNPATTSLLQRDSNNIISCNGSFKDMDYATVAKTGPNDATKTGFAFFFKNTSSPKTYVMNATNGGKFMVAAEYNTSSQTEPSMRFWPSYYWSFTIFKNREYTDLYLGCEKDGRSLLVPMDDTDYPDPRALFITNKYNLDF